MKSEHLTEVKQILKQHQFKKLFSGDTENTFIQFFRYCFVGGFATVVDWALSSLLFYLAFSGSGYAALCNGLSFVAGLLLTIGITKGFAWALADVTSLYQILSKVVSTAVAFFWNFFARKYLLYTKKEA